MKEIKIKAIKGITDDEIKISCNDWNMETRRNINRFADKARAGRNGYGLFDATCDIILTGTTLTEENLFDLSKDQLDIIAGRVFEEINKKK